MKSRTHENVKLFIIELVINAGFLIGEYLTITFMELSYWCKKQYTGRETALGVLVKGTHKERKKEFTPNKLQVICP